MPLPAVFAAARAGAAVSGLERLAYRGARSAGGGGIDHSLNRLWKIDTAFNLGTRLMEQRKWLPGYEHNIAVKVVGGPTADIRRVWYLACSAAFGRYRDRVRTTLNTISFQGTWDVTGKICTVELSYDINATLELFGVVIPRATTSVASWLKETIVDSTPGAYIARAVIGGAAPRAAAVTATGPADSGKDALGRIHRGPEQLTIGGTWPAFLRKSEPGLMAAPLWRMDVECPGSAARARIRFTRVVPLTAGADDSLREFPVGNGSGATLYPYQVSLPADKIGVLARPFADVATNATPTLPDHGRVLTTGEKLDRGVQPPKPALDGQTRSNVLALFSQCLQYPCFLPSSPPCEDSHAGNAGLSLFTPGTPEETYFDLLGGSGTKRIKSLGGRAGGATETLRENGAVFHPSHETDPCLCSDACAGGYTAELKGGPPPIPPAPVDLKTKP